jgi:hypothetical protein
MGWEMRNRGGPYYTRSSRLNGRVVREYLGTGPDAQLIAAQDAEWRREREAKKALERRERERMANLEAVLDRYCAITEALYRAELTRAGYHRHHRGEWRRRRGT